MSYRFLFYFLFLAAFLSPLANADDSVGTISGSFSVEDDGSASYIIPVELPPAIGGMMPEVSIAYNSNNGNGLMGKGWQLNAGSAVHRCGTNLEEDGYIDGVDYDSNDQYCLDGQRLVFDSSRQIYFPRSDYNTVVEGVSNFGNGPSYFILTGSDGTKSYFGQGGNSRLLAKNDSEVFSWSVSSTVDQFGSVVEYFYNSDSSISSISYGDFNISFKYGGSRSIEVSSYYAQTSVSFSTLLTEINISYNQNQVSGYRFSYDEAKDNNTFLEKVTQTSQGDVANKSVRFKWTETDKGKYPQGESKRSAVKDFDATPFTASIGDVNGDGLSDIVWAKSTVSGLRTYASLSKGDGAYKNAKYTEVRDGDLRGFQSHVADVDGDGYADIVWTRDTDDKGLDVVVGLSKGDGTFKSGVWSSPSGTGDGDNYSAIVTDIDGDARADIVWVKTNNSGLRTKTALSLGNGRFDTAIHDSVKDGNFTDYKPRVGDANGDGLTDIIWTKSNHSGLRVSVGLSKGDGYFTTPIWNGPKDGDYESYGSAVGDVNGDGLADVIWSKDTSSGLRIHASLSLGDGRYTDSQFNNVADGDYEKAKASIGDVNGDGLTDVIWTKDTDTGLRAYVALSLGGGHFSDSVWSGPRDGGDSDDFYPLFGDANGDGRTDVLWVKDKSIGLRVQSAIASGPEATLVIDEIIDNLGNSTKVSYGSIAGSADYSEGTDRGYPAITATTSMKVVKNVEIANGVGGLTSTSYKYSNFKVQLKGIGALGFRTIETSNPLTNIKTIKTFSQDWQQRTQGWIQSTQTIASNGTILAESYNQLDNKFRKEDGSRIDDALYDAELPYIKATTSIQRDLDGSVINLTTLHHELNEKGWVESDRTCVTGLPAISSPIDSGIQYCNSMSNKDIDKTTTYEYYDESFAPDFAPLLQVKTTQVTIPDAPPFQPATESRVIAYTYVEETGKLESETVQPNVHPVTNDTFPWSDVWLTKTYDYRSTGQLESTTVTGADIASRSSRVEFDTQNRPWKKFNALNHMEEVLYENASFPWLPTKIISPNGLAVEYQYNSWGRKIKTISADGNWTATDKRWCDNDTQCLYSDEEFYVESSSSIGPNNYVYFDKLGREVRREGVGLHNGVAKPIFQRTYYNDQGLVEFSGQPYYSGDQEYKSETTYDELGRPVTIKDAAGYESTIQYGGRTVIYTDPKMHKKTVVKNALGQQVEVKDTNNKSITYRYDAFGNLVYLEDPSSNQTKIGFNSRGFKVKLDDPDQGSWTYDYNVLGQLTDQTDANNNVVHTEYDLIGRKTLRTDFYGSANAETSNWYYDEATVDNSIGKLTRVTNNHNFEQKLFYNDLYGRPTSTETRINGEVEPYVTSTNYYEDTGRLKDITYPNGYTVRNIYHPTLGSLDSVISQSSNYVFWKAKHTNAKGQLEQSTLGGFIDVTKFYNNQTGMVESIHASHLGMVYQDLAYQWDSVGNLDYFDDHLQGVYEDYVYADLDRLTTVIGSNSTQSISYDELGNIRSKTGTGSYNYNEIAVPSECGADDHAAGPHAVRRITGDKANYFCYDKNGNLVKDKDGRNLKYTAFNKPYEISKGTTAVKFQYAPSRSRFLREDNKNGAITTTYYLGGYEKVVEADNTVKHKVMVAGVAQVVEEVAGSSTTKSINFLLKDQLGSITSIIKAEVVNDMVQGAIVENMSYDAWGNRRLTNLDLLADPDSYKNEWTDRGFTGHEHIDSVGLIHMNGRVYDPIISRFVSPDPIVQAPSNIQSLNRYSYVMNNPSSMVDPSGYSWISKKWKQIRRLGFMGEAVPILYGVTGSAYSAAMGFYNGNKAHNNGASTRQSIKIGAKAAHEATKQMAISQVFWFGVGEIATGFKSLELLGGAALYAPLPTYAQIGVHAVAGGVYEDLNGGKFIHGFLSAGFSKWYGVGYNFDNPAVQSIERAIVGGVTASLAGGNFGRGAFNAVMAFWFNDSHPLHRETRAQKGQGSNPLSVAGDVLGKIWNIPNTVIGLVYGGVGHVAGWMMGTNPYITFGNNAIQFHNNPLMPSAITLGNVIIYGPSTSPNASNVHFQNTPLNHTVGREEFRHTQQGQILGPLYLPAHALGGISSLFRAPHSGLRHGVDAWHSNNFMETGPMQDRIF
ncbi:MAG: FG-GAP-like repeat-containing protein [Pseudomonadales bacterium]|nr:FG-GAP-like repeat-containing protein [Pseudomonadales bacterium]